MSFDYRKKVQDVFDRIEVAFDPLDPDLAECEQSLGAMIITLKGQSKCILSAQPSVQQLWLALASRGTAYHFNYDESSNLWKDDKGQGVELVSFLETYLKEVTGIDLHI